MGSKLFKRGRQLGTKIAASMSSHCHILLDALQGTGGMFEVRLQTVDSKQQAACLLGFGLLLQELSARLTSSL